MPKLYSMLAAIVSVSLLCVLGIYFFFSSAPTPRTYNPRQDELLLADDLFYIFKLSETTMARCSIKELHTSRKKIGFLTLQPCLVLHLKKLRLEMETIRRSSPRTTDAQESQPTAKILNFSYYSKKLHSKLQDLIPKNEGLITALKIQGLTIVNRIEHTNHFQFHCEQAEIDVASKKVLCSGNIDFRYSPE